MSPGRCCCWLVVVCARRVAWLWVDTVLAYACVFFSLLCACCVFRLFLCGLLRVAVRGAVLSWLVVMNCCCLLPQVTLHPDARNTAWVSFDGRHHQELNVGDRFVQ